MVANVMRSRLILVCGMVCAGKTTLAKRLEADRGALRLSPDEWLVQLVGTKHNRRELDRLRGPVESIQWALAASLLRKGTDVILENGFWHSLERLGRLAEAKARGHEVEIHVLDVPTPVLLNRLAKRNRAGGPAEIPVTARELEAWLTSFEFPDEPELKQYDDHTVHRHEDAGDA